MKTHCILNRLGMTRAIRGVIAILGFAVTTAAFAEPIGKVGVLVTGQVLGKGSDVHATSKTKRIVASDFYNYKFTGQVRGAPGTFLGDLIPKNRSIEEFLDANIPGLSRFLSGTFDNRRLDINGLPINGSGTLPVTVLSRKFKLEIPIVKKRKTLGTLKISLKFVGKILEDGECVIDVTVSKLSFQDEDPLDAFVLVNFPPKTKSEIEAGSFIFKGGSRLLISAAPTFTFKRENTNVNESAKTVVVRVFRDANRHGAFSVNYSTVTGVVDGVNYGDANSTDFTSVANQTLQFADLDQTKDIVINITNNHALHANGRSFTLKLSDPGNGAVLGAQTRTKVTIQNEAVVSP